MMKPGAIRSGRSPSRGKSRHDCHLDCQLADGVLFMIAHFLGRWRFFVASEKRRAAGICTDLITSLFRGTLELDWL